MAMRRLLHVKGDVMCTMLLLLLFCLLLYVRLALVSPEWEGPAWRLEIHSSTSSSRTLLGADRRAARRNPQQQEQAQSSPSGAPPPPCKQQPKTKAQSKAKGRSKSRRKGPVAPSKAPGKAPPTMPPFDFQGYLRDKDKRDFRLLLDQPRKCQPAPPYMLIAVKSVVADFDKRQVVRRTWGREGRFQDGASIRTVFLLGVPRNRSALPLWEQLLAYESQTFRDVLLWDFEDTFFNLTLKETHFLQWVNHSCPQVQFIFKGDADVYVNVENILEMLQGQKPEEDVFIGDIIVNAKPIRRRTSKYFVPEFMYGGGLYPSYAGGGGFVMSGHTARRLSAACQQVELFPIDDVFLGMCLQVIGVRPSRHQGFRTFGIPRPSAAPHLQTFDPCFYRELMVVHSLSVPQIWLMWHLLHDPTLRCHARSASSPQQPQQPQPQQPQPPFRWRTATERQAGDGDQADYGGKRVFVLHE